MDLIVFAYHKQANLNMRNFKTETAKKEYNTLMERPLLGLCKKLLLDSVECSVLPLDGTKHNTLLFLKLISLNFP